MDKAKHTPGPWSLELRGAWPFGVRVVGANGDEVMAQAAIAHSSKQRTRTECELGVGFTFDRESAVSAVATQDADASLIAAAPELLGALQSMFNEFGEFEYNVETLDMARAAIRKATGA